ncbi:MAG: radical SAM peptide maturase [Bacteroidales bacterium]|nr:radical SAM peptide maturase [Bacteroidales bacterium]
MEFPIIINGSQYSAKEYLYYKKKFQLLIKAGYFDLKQSDSYVAGRLTSHDIDYELSNLKSLVFEVTERCNLKCNYCFYGENYKQNEIRSDQDFDVVNAKRIIDLLKEKWLSNKNNSIGNEIFIGFYGGEPLLNFKFIKEIVSYIELIKDNTDLNFRFNMTTNALLLPKFMQFLVNHNFSLTISIDGDKKSNSHRVFANNKHSFEIVYQNIKLIAEKYPEYFQTNVMFNAVLHEKNDLLEVQKFITKEFSKSIRCSEVNPLLVGKSFKYDRQNLNLNDKNDARCFLDSGQTLHYNMFLKNFSKFHFENLESLFVPNYMRPYIPTGTCIPFSKRMFITTKGKILPCETIGHEFALGEIVNGKINLNNEEIADKYNSYFNKMDTKCKSCYKINFCTDVIGNYNCTVFGNWECTENGNKDAQFSMLKVD